MCENLLLLKVLELYKKNDWKSVIELNKDSDLNEAQKILWVWPDESNLKFINKVLNDHNISGVVSLGCGCGLLEWIIQTYTGKSVIGFEVNKEWWDSKYSIPQFIQLTYPLLPLKENLNAEYALLFCYFNNGPAFHDYINHYDGNVIFIIGPGKGRGRHTNPLPFAPNFQQTNWTLLTYEEVKSTKDYITVYVRNTQCSVN